MSAGRSNISNDDGRGACPENRAEALHRYLDGDLPFVDQAPLFEHLATCDECRRLMESVLAFRRMSRQEFLTLPPAADDTFFERLARLKNLNEQVDRKEDRKPLWDSRRSVSLGAALALAAVVFVIGLVVPMPARTEYATALIQLEVERVQFEPSDSIVIESPIYHWIDGITVEADRSDPVPSAGASR